MLAMTIGPEERWIMGSHIGWRERGMSANEDARP